MLNYGPMSATIQLLSGFLDDETIEILVSHISSFVETILWDRVGVVKTFPVIFPSMTALRL